MTKQRDIQSGISFDTTQFSRGVNSAIRRITVLGKTVTEIIKQIKAVAEGSEDAFKNIKLPEIKAPRMRTEGLNQGRQVIRLVARDAETTSVSISGLNQELEELNTDSRKAAGGQEKLPPALRNTGRASREAASGSQLLATALSRLQEIGALFLSGGVLVRLSRGLNAAATASFRAETSLRLLGFQSETSGQDLGTLTDQLDVLATKFNTTTAILAQPSTILLRLGFSAEQVAPLLERVGASAVAAGKDVNQGFEIFAEAVARRNSVLLNSIGILGNFTDFLGREAKRQGTTIVALDEESAARSIYNGILAETNEELRALDISLSGYAGQSLRLNKAQYELGLTIGDVVQPALGRTKDAISAILNVFLRLPEPIKNAAIAFTLLTASVAATSLALAFSFRVIVNQQVLGTIIAVLLKNETLLRSRLGGVILAQAASLKVLDAAQLSNLQTTRASGAATNLLSAGITKVITVTKGLIVAMRAAIFTPQGLALAALALAAFLVFKNFEVLAPALANVSAAFTRTTEAGSLFTIMMTLLGRALGPVAGVALALFVGTLTLLSLAISGAAQLVELLAIQFIFLSDVINKGPAEATRLWNERMDELAVRSRESYDEIIKTGQAGVQAAVGLNEAAEGAENATDAMEALNEQQQTLRDNWTDRSMALELEINTGSFQKQLSQATSQFDDLIKEMEAELARLNQDDPFKPIVENMLAGIRTLREEAKNLAIADIIGAAQQKALSAEIEVMEEGTIKIQKTYQNRREILEAEFEAETRGLEDNQELRTALQFAYLAQLRSLNNQETQELANYHEDQLNELQEFNSQLQRLRLEIDRASAEGSNNSFAVIQAEHRAAVARIKDQEKELLDAVTGTAEERLAQQEEISTLIQTRLVQIEEDTTRQLVAETERRQNALVAITRRISTLINQDRAIETRSRGDASGAISLELEEQLAQINYNLEQELKSVELTQKERVALIREASRLEINARRESARKIEDIERNSAERQRKIRQTLAEEVVADTQSSGDERGAMGQQLDIDLAALQESTEAQLSTLNLYSEEANLIREEAAAEAIKIQGAYNRAVAELNETEAEATLDTLTKAADAATQAQIAALDGAIPQLEASLEQERELLKREQQEQLKDFKGSAEQRERLVKDHQKQQAFATQVGQQRITKEAKAGLDNYLEALANYNQKVEELQQKNYEDNFARQQALNSLNEKTASADLANFRDLPEPDVGGQIAAFEKLSEVYESNIALAQDMVEQAKNRKGENAGLISAIDAEIAAYEQLRQATLDQRDALKQQFDQQLNIISQGDSVIAYYNKIANLSSNDSLNTLSGADEAKILKEQITGLVAYANELVKANAPLEDRLKVVDQIYETEKQLFALGETGLNVEDLETLAADAAKVYDDYANNAGAAVENAKTLQQEITSLGEGILEVTSTLNDFVTSIGDESGLTIPIVFEIDEETEKQLNEAIESLEETFGATKAKEIINKFSTNFKLGAALKPNVKTASDTLSKETTIMGTKAGSGLMTAFSKGLTNNRSRLMNAVKSVLNEVRGYMPASDAKQGPLSDLTWSGGKMATTFGEGFLKKKNTLGLMADELMSTVKPKFTVPTSRSVPGLASEAMGKPPVNMYINGSKQMAPGLVAWQARSMVTVALRELEMQGKI